MSESSDAEQHRHLLENSDAGQHQYPEAEAREGRDLTHALTGV